MQAIMRLKFCRPAKNPDVDAQPAQPVQPVQPVQPDSKTFTA